MKEEIILTPELDYSIRRTAITELLLRISRAITNKYFDSDDPSLYLELIQMVDIAANQLRNEYRKEYRQ